ncbi:MAG TPA: PAS domain S-box protein [Candidatus Acidoferrum sp.]|nr:PAS domain S-box protein [Candidatus Acidoferrum sp.]
MEFWKTIFSSGGFQPHGFCYQWNSGLVALHVTSDLLIALSYFAIPIVLIRFVRKRTDLPFSWMFVCFGVFIVACGMTHLMEVWNLWHAQYWLSGALKAVTAAASVPTAWFLFRIVPEALTIPSSSRWIQANAALEQEIQRRESLEAELRKSEVNYREEAAFLNLTADAIFVRDITDKIVFWNQSAERRYGWRKDELQSNTSHDLLQTVFPKPLKEIEAELFSAGSWEGELLHTRRDGSQVVDFSRWVVKREGDKPVAILESNRDITQRVRAQKKFRDLLEATPDAMIILNKDGFIELANTQMTSVFGYSKEEIVGKPVELLLPERFRHRHEGHRVGFFQSPKNRQMGAGLELYALKKDGTEFPVEVSLSPLETEDGILVMSAIRDISSRKEAEEALRAQRNELARANAEMTAANRELEAFSYSVSHDLRAPLRSIDGFSLALLEDCSDKLDAEGKKHLQRIRTATQRMGALIDDLLNLSRVTRAAIHLEKIDLSAMAAEVFNDLPKSQTRREVEIHIEPGLEVFGDAHLLRIVLENLIGNAVKFSSKRSSARIELGQTANNGNSAFYVRDNGAGFDPEYADRLFGAFQRLHAASEFPGTGVGLATVQRIVHRHGGRIWAESSAGKGAIFYFTLAGTNS